MEETVRSSQKATEAGVSNAGPETGSGSGSSFFHCFLSFRVFISLFLAFVLMNIQLLEKGQNLASSKLIR